MVPTAVNNDIFERESEEMFDMRYSAKMILDHRKKKDMTQVELADAMGVSYQAVSNWERGNSMPDISKLQQLADILEVSIDELLGVNKGTKVIQKVINNENNIETEAITLDEVAEVAPVLKPSQTDSLLEKILESQDEVTIEDVIVIAPFLSDEFIAGFLGKLEDIGDIKKIVQLAPFINDSELDKLVEKLTGQVSLREISLLAPFLSDDTLDTMVMKALEEGHIDECAPLYPFLSKETMEKLAEKIIKEHGVKAISELAPFL